MRYKFRLLVMACVMLLLLPCRAHASTLVGSYEIPTDADVVACDFLGYDYNTMDSGLKALLHNSTTGGGVGTDSNPNFAGYAAFRNSLYSPTIAGDYQWYSRYDGFMFVDAADKARSDIKGAVRWWDEYGNEQGGGTSENVPISASTVLSPIFGYYYYPSNGYQSTIDASSCTMTVNFTDYALTSVGNVLLNYPYYLIIVTKGHQQGGVAEYAFVSTTPISYSLESQGTTTLGNFTYEKNKLYIHSEDGFYLVNAPTQTGYSVDSVTYRYSSFIVGAKYQDNALLTSNVIGMWSTMGSSGGGSGGGPSGGPVPPETPTTPEVDEQPNYNTNINVNGTINVDNSSTGATEFEFDLSELLDILKTINDNLVAFAEDMHSMWDWWSEEMGVIESEISTFQDAISTWLQMIYERLNSIGSPNPTTQPTSWLDWLRALLTALVGDLPSSIAGIQQSLSALRNLFPFSIPWDLAVLLGLFVSSPVTPVFDLPFPYSANGVAYIHVDCSQWNGIMSAVRSVELVIFAAGLALRTRELIKGVEVE